MKTFMVTFGQRFRHDEHKRFPAAHPDGWVTIEAHDDSAARMIAFDRLGEEWAFLYREADFTPGMYPMGELARFSAVAS